MVGVQMGDVDLVHLLGLVARGPQIGLQPAQGGAEKPGRAGVHQHQLGTGVDQIAIDRGLQRHAQIGVAQRAQDLARLALLEQLVHRQVHRAVVERGDLEIAQHHAIEARGLGLDLGSCGLGTQAQQGQAEGQHG